LLAILGASSDQPMLRAPSEVHVVVELHIGVIVC
jgi:hypothetical protein